jgi:1-phosphatidylinositol phosphodiesterase
VAKLHRALVRAGILVAALAVPTVALATPATAHTTDGYSHDSTIGLTDTDWMSRIDDRTPLSRLSLPGTHDTGAYVFGGDTTITQSMNLAEQLKSGIRAWDIRLGKEIITGRLKVYHGDILQGQDFENDVLATANKFLDDHPREVVVMRIQRDTGTATGFDSMVKAALDKYARVYRGTNHNPSLTDIRGKMVVLQNFPSSAPVGIPWDSLTIQDQYHLTTNWDLATKWNAIKNQLEASRTGSPSTTYVNFLSGSVGSMPYFVASGHSSPQTGAPNLLTGWTRGVINTCQHDSKCISEYRDVNCFLGTCSVAFEGTNVMTMDLLNRRTVPARVGIVYADFPGKGLVKAVINSNTLTTGVLRGQQSGRCVDVPGGSQANDTAVWLWDCHAGANQTWALTSSQQLLVYGSKCLDAKGGGTGDGTVVQIYDCNGTGAQKWTVNTDGTVVNVPSGKCLDAFGGGTTNETRLVLWTCLGGSNQKWLLA